MGERARRALRRNQSRRQSGRRLQRLTIASTDHLMVLASLPPAEAGGAAEVLAAYRLRWQIELAFKRLKGGLGMGRLLARDRAMARSWLLSHLILALLVEEAADEVLHAPPLRAAGVARPASLWRLHGALRRALLGVVMRAVPPQALARSAGPLVRHICDPPRRRPWQTALARVGVPRHRAGGGAPALPFPKVAEGRNSAVRPKNSGGLLLPDHASGAAVPLPAETGPEIAGLQSQLTVELGCAGGPAAGGGGAAPV